MSGASLVERLKLTIMLHFLSSYIKDVYTKFRFSMNLRGMHVGHKNNPPHTLIISRTSFLK